MYLPIESPSQLYGEIRSEELSYLSKVTQLICDAPQVYVTAGTEFLTSTVYAHGA